MLISTCTIRVFFHEEQDRR